MTTLIIAYFVISVILIFVFIFSEIIPTYKVGLWTKEIILFVLLTALAAIMLFIPTHIQKTEAVGDAVLVERFEDAALYYEESSDMYFAVETNRWNIFEMYKRVEIPQELAKEKIGIGETVPTEQEN